MADEPTAFVATYGQGKPVIAIRGEFDALPGLSQQALPQRAPVAANAPGHGWGHNLLISGAALAAVAVKRYMAKSHILQTLLRNTRRRGLIRQGLHVARRLCSKMSM